MMLNIVEKLAHASNFTRGRTQPIKYIVIHYVGALGGALNNGAYFQGANRQASAHYFVGHASESAVVVRSVLDSDTAWHCGAQKYTHPGCRNANSLGVELCCRKDSTGNWYFDDATVHAAINLVSGLMVTYGIPAANVIRHYDVSGKVCPEPYVRDAKAWAAFKTAIAMTETKEVETVERKIKETTTRVGSTVIPSLEIDDVTYVPLRPIVDALTPKVSWTELDGASVSL